MTPRVSINLCCFNSEKYLQETIESVCQQTFEDWELVVVNDGSTDSTELIIQNFRAQGWPIVYHTQMNSGLGASRNKALELSQGEFIAFLDHDDLWLPEKLEKQLCLFEIPEIELVYSDAIMIDSQGNRGSVFSCLDERRLVSGNPRDSLLSFGGFLCLSTAVVRSSLFDRIGKFDAALSIVEDTDMWFRIAEVGEFACSKEPLACYRVHQSSSIRTRKERHWGETIHLLLREIKRGNMSPWARRASSVRLLEFTREYVPWLWSQRRIGDSLHYLIRVLCATNVQSIGWFVRKLFRVRGEPGI